MNELDMMSPSKIAAEYGGDKRKIAQAAQMGLVDPTVAVMAGMFIDRMRNAASQEQQPATTVAQDVMTPPAPVAPVESGLAALPVPEEAVPSYEGGGIVAFNGERGSEVDLSDPDILLELERRRLGLSRDVSPLDRLSDVYGGSGMDDFDRLADIYGGSDSFGTRNVPASVKGRGAPDGKSVTAIAKPSSLEDIITAAQRRRQAVGVSDAEKAQQDYYKSAAARAAEAKSRGFNEFLVEAGLRTAASKSPRFLQALGEGAAAAVPRLTGSAKEAREMEEAGVKGLADIAKARRLEELAGITAGERMYGDERTIQSREAQSELDRQNRIAVANIPPKEMQVAAQLRKDNPGMSYLDSIAQASQALAPKDTYNATRTAVSAAAKDANAEFLQRATFDPKLQEDMRKAAAGDAAAQARVKDVKDKIQAETFRLYQVQGVDLSGGRMGASTVPTAPTTPDPLGIRR